MVVSAIQFDISWENPKENYTLISNLIDQINQSDIILLPEMWNTGFSMNASELAESMNGPSIEAMMNWSKKNDALVMGSLIIKDDGKYYNRMVGVCPDGEISTYDKKHLFSYAGEHENFSAGERPIIVEYKGWRILPQICYDLRFPSFSRYSDSLNYDLLVYSANWPYKRALAWNTLLKARAIENQAYVIGLNRIGLDGNSVYYSGDSQIIDFDGNIRREARQRNMVLSSTLDLQELRSYRAKFPFLNDRDFK